MLLIAPFTVARVSVPELEMVPEFVILFSASSARFRLETELGIVAERVPGNCVEIIPPLLFVMSVALMVPDLMELFVDTPYMEPELRISPLREIVLFFEKKSNPVTFCGTTSSVTF